MTPPLPLKAGVNRHFHKREIRAISLASLGRLKFARYRKLKDIDLAKFIALKYACPKYFCFPRQTSIGLRIGPNFFGCLGIF